MNDEQLKVQIGQNISLQRKKAGLTQAGLAAKLNYSDKAVSKWERGESIPDVLTLVNLAEQLDITVNELLSDPNELPRDGGAGTLEKAMTQVSEKALKRKANKIKITDRVAAFERIKRYVVIAHNLFKIYPRRKNSLAPNIFARVKKRI